MIYFIQDEQTLLIKIGFTTRNLAERLASLQTGCPGRLVVVHKIPGGSRVLEKELHQDLARWRARGEWFKPAREVIQCMMRSFAGLVSDERVKAAYVAGAEEAIKEHKKIQSMLVTDACGAYAMSDRHPFDEVPLSWEKQLIVELMNA